MKQENGLKEKAEFGFFPIEDRLVIKLYGTYSDVSNHIRLLKRIYGANRLNCSPILRDKFSDGYFCFVNVLKGGTEQ